jgi:RimJ/RimL family protein N-acetyltransferase
LTTEAIAELLRHAFTELGARRVAALTDAENKASRALCETVGMQLEGILRNERTTPAGKLCDTCIYAAVRGETLAA